MGSFWKFIPSYPEIFLAIICFFGLSIFRLIRQCQKSALPVNWPVVGMLPFLVRNRHYIHDKVVDLLREAGCTFMVFGPWLLNMNFLITCDPATVNHCLNTHFDKYPKGREFAEMFDILGDGLLIADSESWEYQRRVAVSVFASRAFRSFTISTISRKVGKVLLPYLDHMAKHSLEVELEGVFMRLSLDISYSTVFAADLDCLSVSSPMPVFGRATKEAEEAMLFRHIVPSSLWKLLRWLNIGTEKKHANAKVVVNRFIYEEIAKRKAQGCNGSQADVLSMYMKLPLDPGMSEQHKTEFLRDTAVGFILAGKDLIAVTLTWFFYMMCKHPDVEARILEELKGLQSSTWPGDFSVFECDALRSAIYLQAALLETLRLFPATPFEEKEALVDDVLPNGTKVTKGTRVVFSLYAMGRIEGIWGKDCMEFRPERWVSKSGRLRHQPSYKFLSFNSGPRSCIGKDLGLSNMKITAASIIYNFKVELVRGHAVMPQSSVILHMQNGMMVRLKRRLAA
ncbi:noroxomaritidine synthase-like [Phragmites australis]|uniref:noroxomaritidine synthase-like n=1 Tax=Phragmites australis TaxID=29695 RepID=UPI002D76728A|nr:noroxomaritidine synthase-like [Phragmites australis]